MLYFSIQHPDEYSPEFVTLLSVSQNPNNIKDSVIFETNSDTITLEYTENIDSYEIYSGNYGILKYKDEYTKDFRVVGMGQFTTAQEFADYFDNESIKDVKECKYYVKDKGKIVVEEDILKDIIELVDE